MYLVYKIQLCGCVSFLVVAGNCSLNENTFLQKNHIMGALLLIGIVAGWWDASRNDAIIVSYLMISRDVREF